MRSKSMKMVLWQEWLGINYAWFMNFLFFLSKKHLTKDYFHTSEINLTTRGPLYTCLVIIKFVWCMIESWQQCPIDYIFIILGNREVKGQFFMWSSYKVPITTGVSALFTECQNSCPSGKYGSFNFRASILFYSKIWWKIASEISFLWQLNEKYIHLRPKNS